MFGFFGLDALLLYWAFKINYRRAAAYEVVTVTPIHTGKLADQPTQTLQTDRNAHSVHIDNSNRYLFAQTLGVNLPPLFTQLLTRANGGETILARSEALVPADLRSHTRVMLWQHLLSPLAVWGVDTTQYYGRLLPIGRQHRAHDRMERCR